MGATLDYTVEFCPKESPARSRRRVAEKIVQFDTLDSPWTSSRRIAGQLDVPVRTLHYWVRRERTLIAHSSWPKPVARFLETPEGLDLLHRLFMAALLVFVEANDCGLRNLRWFLKLSGLGEFIAPSYGAQQAVAEELESLLVRFGVEEDQRLAESMPPREITLCEDETFHPQICLVAIEPVSNFILVEQYQPQRDAATWQRLRTLATEVLARARSPDGLWGTFHSELQAELESKARQCADFFQRSSSCVEGRNGQLSLRHHALHHLIARKLQALTVLHNYAVQRADGSTAAGRFYGGTPRDLFGWLLEHLSLPARPRPVRRSA